MAKEEKDEGKKEQRPIDGVKKYEWAGLAGQLVNSKERIGYSIDALRMHYKGYDPELGNDMILNEAFNDARQGLAQGHITSKGVLAAITSYGGKYTSSVGQCTLGEMLGYNSKVVEVPESFRKFAGRYSNTRVVDLVKKVQDGDRDATNAFAGLQTMETCKFEGYLYPELVKMQAKEHLEEIGREYEGKEQPKAPESGESKGPSEKKNGGPKKNDSRPKRKDSRPKKRK